MILNCEILKALAKLSGPIFLSFIGLRAMEAIDTAMVARVDLLSLSAAAFGNSLAAIFLVAGLGFSSAISVLIPRVREDTAKRNDTLRHAFYLNLFISIVFIAILEILRRNLSLFGQVTDILPLTSTYLIFIELSILPELLFECGKHFTDGLGLPLRGTFFIAISLLLNVFFNWILVFGNLGCPALGLLGAGLGTLLARSITTLGFYAYLKHTFSDIHFWPTGLFLAKFRQILALCIPNSASYLFEAGIFSVTQIMSGWIGEVELAANQIVLRVTSLTFMIPLSISFAVGIKISQSLATNHVALAKRYSYNALFMTCSFMLLLAIALFLGKDYIGSMFIADTRVIAVCSSLFMIASLFQIFDGAQALGIGILRGFLDTKTPMLITFFAYWLFGIPCSYFLGITLHLGIEGLWYGLSIGLITSTFLLFLRVWKNFEHNNDASSVKAFTLQPAENSAESF